MIIERHREKLLNAIIYFVSNTEYCHKVKLFKLLYFLDFDHFKQTGRSATGTNYSAWPKGGLFHEISIMNSALQIPDMLELMSVSGAFEGGRLDIYPKVAFLTTHFSRRELSILEGARDGIPYYYGRSNDRSEPFGLCSLAKDSSTRSAGLSFPTSMSLGLMKLLRC